MADAHEDALRETNARLTQAKRTNLTSSAALPPQARTTTRSHDDLEQFAYSAWHDLREPLRMVATYSDMLRRHLRDKLDASGVQYLGYILAGAERMEVL
jgi:light-regulated signal transduction histidine kinase (bacteriophytochrome)